MELWVEIISHFTDPSLIWIWLKDTMFGSATQMAIRRLLGPMSRWSPEFSQLDRLEDVDIRVETLEGLIQIASLPRLTRASLRLGSRNSRVYLDWIVAFQTLVGKRSFRGTYFKLIESLEPESGDSPIHHIYTIDQGVPLLQTVTHEEYPTLTRALCYNLDDVLHVLTTFRQVAPLWCYDHRWHLVIRPDSADIIIAIEMVRFLQTCPELIEIRTTTDCMNYVIISHLLPQLEAFHLDGPGWIWELPASPKIRILDARIDITHEDITKFHVKYPHLEEISIRAPWALKEGLNRLMYLDFWNHFLERMMSLPPTIKRIQVADLGSQWILPSDPRIERVD
jgi:hypothetical protein